MDFVTHTLSGLSTSRLIGNQNAHVRCVGLSALVASLLPDIDVILYAFAPEAFGRYHRVITHSIPFLLLIGLFSGTVAWWVARHSLVQVFSSCVHSRDGAPESESSCTMGILCPNRIVGGEPAFLDGLDYGVGVISVLAILEDAVCTSGGIRLRRKNTRVDRVIMGFSSSLL